MAGIEIRGFEELRRNTEHIRRDVLERALEAAEDAAAKVMKEAVAAAAPRDTGQLAGSVIVYEGKDPGALTGSARRRLLVGPQKKKGYYGYFLEKGTAGGEVRPRPARGKKALHWKRGGSDVFAAKARIPALRARPWFGAAAASAEQTAYEAGKRAFEEVLARELGGMI